MGHQEKLKVTCPYCGRHAKLITGSVLYPHRQELSHLWFWRCSPCGAYVGTHENSPRHTPKGSLANAKLRAMRSTAHHFLDAHWRTQNSSRRQVYTKLAEFMGLTEAQAHIGKFDEQQCRMAIDLAADHSLWRTL